MAIDMMAAGATQVGAGLARAGLPGKAAESALQRTGAKILQDGQQLVGVTARAVVRRYGVEAAWVGHAGVGLDAEALATRIEDGDVFTVTTYNGVFLEMPAHGDFPGVIIELARLRACVDFDGDAAHWCAEEVDAEEVGEEQ